MPLPPPLLPQALQQLARELKVKLAQATQEKVEVLLKMAAAVGGVGGGSAAQEAGAQERGVPIPARSPSSGAGSLQRGGGLAAGAALDSPGSTGGLPGAWSEDGEGQGQGQGQASYQQLMERVRNIERLVTVAGRFRAQLAAAAAALQAQAPAAASPARPGGTPPKGVGGATRSSSAAVSKVLEECRAYRQQAGIPEDCSPAAAAAAVLLPAAHVGSGGSSLSSSLGQLSSLVSPGKGKGAAVGAAAVRRVDRDIAGEVLDLVELAGRALGLQQQALCAA
jgi:hypothetical protein